MAENKFSLEPTLEIDKSKDIKSLKSIVTDINKAGKNNTFNIINNNDISDEKKYLSLWAENNRLLGIINQIQTKLTELENEINYNEYLLYNSIKNVLDFEALLQEFHIDVTRKNSQQNYVKYIVNKKDYEIFLACLGVYYEKMTEKELKKWVMENYKEKIKIPN